MAKLTVHANLLRRWPSSGRFGVDRSFVANLSR
jgi:hypothetical protein